MAKNNARTKCNHRYYEDKGLARKLYLCTLRHGFTDKQIKCVGREHESCPLNLRKSGIMIQK